MRLSKLSQQAQDGLVQWGRDVYNDPMHFEGITVEEWAWALFCLRVSQDNVEWFPCGKWTTLNHIQLQLEMEALREIKHHARL